MPNSARNNSAFHLLRSPFLLSIVAAAILLPAHLSLRAQQPTISVDVKVVNVLATVRDKHGQIINSLSKDDFLLQEDGRPQDIRYFSRESDLPLALGLLVDTSLSQRHVLDQERSASYSFLDRMLRAKDTAFVIHFDREAELLQDLTSSREKLQSALDKLKTPDAPTLARGGGGQGSPGGGGGWPGGGHHGGGGHGGAGTVLYDSVYLASDELMKPQKGRKALIVLTDGVDRGSKETLEAALEAAQRADTVVYSILFKDDEAYSNWGRGGMGGHGGWGGRGGPRRYPQESRPDGKKIMERICSRPAGACSRSRRSSPSTRSTPISRKNCATSTTSATPPPKNDAGSGYRKIALTTKKKDLVVQARDGYYADR